MSPASRFRRPSVALAIAVLTLAGLTALPVARAVNEADLLPVDKAFAPSAHAIDHGRIELDWSIAKGYYLYRERISATTDPSFQAAALQLPEGIHKHDPFFGEVQIYHDRVTATLPGTPPADVKSVDVVEKYQGCADAGVCYPPQKRTLHVELPAAVASAASGTTTPADPAASASSLAALTHKGGPGLVDSSALPPEQAFGFEAIVDTPDRLLVRFTPAKGYYLYRDKTHFAIRGTTTSVRTGVPAWPAAQQRHDDHYGDVAVYTDLVEVPLPLERANKLATKIVLDASFQGCQIDGICYPPMQRSVALDLPAGGSGGTTATGAAKGGITLDWGNLWLAILAALGAGLVLNVMPCVLPVLSLKVLAIVESGESPRQARRHALWYTAGVLSTFVAIGMGVVALRLGGHEDVWGWWMQQPGIVAVLAYLMFSLGLSLSGLLHIGTGLGGLGQSLTSRSGASGDFFTGVLAVAVASPCTAPFMTTAVTYAIAAPLANAFAVFVFLGLGLALPFLIVCFVPALATRLPKPGAWMETLKQGFAFPLYLTAAWLASVVAAQRGSTAVLYLSAGAVLLAFGLWWWERSRYSRHRAQRLVAALVVASALLVPLPIHHLPEAAKRSAEAGTVAYSAGKLDELRAQHRVVFIDMTADWCVNCKINEAAVLSRPVFRRSMAAADAAYMVGDYTNVDPAITAFLEAHHAVGVPLYVVYPRDGGEGEVLPTLLSESTVEAALTRAAR